VTFWVEWIIYICAAAAVCVISFFVLAESTRLVRYMGINGMNALSKLMGFLLLALAVQFILSGTSTTLEHVIAIVK
jgi:multiple antibiotic resistance protein